MYVHTALTSDNTNQSVQATLEVILTLDSKTTRGPASPEPRFSKSRLLTSSAPRLQSGHTATSQLGHRSARSGLKTFAQQRINHSLPHWRKDGQKRSCCGTCNNSVSENFGLVLFDPHRGLPRVEETGPLETLRMLCTLRAPVAAPRSGGPVRLHAVFRA